MKSGGQTPAAQRRIIVYIATSAVVPWRWIVERTFAWLGQYRRLKSDYERLPETTEAIIHIAMIRLMVRRLAA